MEAFSEVLEPLVVVDMHNPKFDHIHSFDINFQETFQKDVSLWINSLFVSIFYIPSIHFVLSLTLSSHLICIVLSPPKSLPFWRLNDLLRDLSIYFVSPSYAEAQALTSLPSPPSWILSCGYDLGVKNYFNDEALEDV